MKVSTFAERFRKALEYRQVSQTELHNKTGISTGAISTYLKGTWKPRQDRVNLISQALNVDPAWLMGYEVPMTTPTISKPELKKVPMLGYAAAGQPLEDINQDTTYVDMGGDYKVDFCITVAGDSMINAGINDGDVVFVKEQPEVENGQIGCFEIDREKVCLKRFYKIDSGVMLVSENPAYKPMVFNKNNCQDFRCLGLAVLKQSVIK